MTGCKKDKPAEGSWTTFKTADSKKNTSTKTRGKPANPPQKKSTKQKSADDSKPIVKPDDTSSGEVVLVNKNARFVVVNFAGENIPPPGRKLSVYHDGLKIGELKVTGPQREANTVADIVTGEAGLNDEVREE